MPNEFVFDVLWTLRELQIRSSENQIDTYADAVARYVLVQMGYSVAEVDEANNVFIVRVDMESLGDFEKTVERIADAVEEHDYLKESIVAALSATGHALSMRLEPTERQIGFVKAFQGIFDMKPSQFQQAVDRGADWAVGLAYVAEQYMKLQLQLDPVSSQK